MPIYPSGTIINNRYEIVQGPKENPSLEGGMGLVYLCIDCNENNKPVALKTFKPESLTELTIRDRFLREGETWVRLGNHPNIVRCYRVFKPDISPEVFLVLELIGAAEDNIATSMPSSISYQHTVYNSDPKKRRSNASLRSWLSPGKPISVEQSLLFALYIARGMKHATTKIPDLVHRDLKPSNILIGRDGLLRVTDFGLATVTKNSAEGGGTPLYMAPEQWDNKETDLRADIYAFGCILYEMLSGYAAVEGSNRLALKLAHQSGQVRALPKDLNIKVTELTRQCMELKPESRPSNWQEVESAVENVYKFVTGKDVPIEIISQEETQIERVATGWSHQQIGLAYNDISKFDTATKHFERALTIGRMEKDRALEAGALGSLGLSYFYLSQTSKAIEYYNQWLDISLELRDRSSELKALHNLGLAYLDLNEFDKAIELFELALSIAQEIDDQIGIIHTLGSLGEAYRHKGDAKKTIEYREQELALAYKINDLPEIGNAYASLGMAYSRLGDVRRALEHYHKNLDIAIKLGDRFREARALSNMGGAYLDLEDPRNAIKYFEKSIKISREIGDRRGEAAALGDLGVTYKNIGDLEYAIKLYEQHLKIVREIGDRAQEAGTVGNLGEAYRLLGNPRKAVEFQEQRLAIVRELGDRYGESQTLGNLGVAWAALGDTKRSQNFYEQRLTIAQDIGDIRGAAFTSYNLARLLMKQGSYRKALQYAEYAFAAFMQVGRVKDAQDAQNLKTSIHSQMW